MLRHVIILSGPPGAGKSTVARALAHTSNLSVHLHTDDFWRYIVQGAIEPFRPESESQNKVVLEVVSHAAFTYATGGYTVIVDGVVGPWLLRHFTEARQGHPGVALDYIVLRPDRATAVARATCRTGVDDLTDPAVVSVMCDQFTDLGSLNSHVIDTTDEEPAQTLATVISALSSKTFRVR